MFKTALLSLVISILMGSCQVGRYIIYNFADIKDHKKFPNRKLSAPEETFYFPKDDSFVLDSVYINGTGIELEEYLEDNQTVAFLIIKNDSLIYEKYFNKYQEKDIVPSFSMAKSFTSLLIGCAIEDGYIESTKESVSNYIPELKANGFDGVTIEHVLNMTTGIDIDESYINPFGHAAAIYYGRKLRKKVLKYKLKNEPGSQFDYTSGTTQLLGLILERALKGDYTITEYFNRKIWQPLEMEFDGSWSIDKKKNGMEKTFCCVNARARDYAKIGRLMFMNGQWNGKTVVPASWVEQSTSVNDENGSALYYQYQWWILNEHQFMAQGILGQYIYVDRKNDVVIVRLGKKGGNISWWQFFPYLSEKAVFQ